MEWSDLWQLLKLKTLMVRHGESSASSYLADPTSHIPSHCTVIILFNSVPVHQLLWLALWEEFSCNSNAALVFWQCQLSVETPPPLDKNKSREHTLWIAIHARVVCIQLVNIGPQPTLWRLSKTVNVLKTVLWVIYHLYIHMITFAMKKIRGHIRLQTV